LVNASLNWASIVGIVLAVGGAMLYFMRSFKPALARDYDVFFAAIGLLCGGILFFQGWRLDPILQFGQFLLAGTTVFFAYESVRLRGVATEQARRSAYFDDEPAPARGPSGGLRGGWDDSFERFDEPQPLRRRFSGRDDEAEERSEDDFYRPRRTSRAAIPEQAASRRPRGREDGQGDWDRDDERSRRLARFRAGEEPSDRRPDFGDRRSQRDDQKRGSRPTGRARTLERETRDAVRETPRETPRGMPVKPAAEDAAFSPRQSARPRQTPSSEGPSVSSASIGRPAPRSSRPRDNSPRDNRPRDNSSRFDD